MAEPTPADLARRELARRELARRGVAVAAPFPAKAPRRASGSTDAIGAEPAGEGDEPSGLLDTAKRVGSAVVDAVTGNQQETPETQSLPDFNLMPEMRQALISNALPGVGSVTGPAVVGVEQVARNLNANPSEGFGLPAAARATKAALKTSLGTTLAGHDEQIAAIVANNPGVKVRQDAKGNVILTSAQDGKDYIVPPGARGLDVGPRVAQSIAATIPAATAGPATVAGRTLGNVASKALAGGVAGTFREAAQAAGGGNFDVAPIVFDAAANAAAPALSAAKGAIVAGAEESAAKLAAENAARREAQAAINAAAPAKAPTSFKEVVAPIQSVADQVAKLSPKQRWLLKQVPVVGKALDEIDQLAKILKDEAGEGAKKLPQEARDLVDDILKSAGNAAGLADEAAAPGVAQEATAVGRRGAPAVAEAVDESASAVEPPTIAPTRTANARARQPVVPAEAPTPPTPQPAPIPEEVTRTANVPRLPPPTEGLEPTEVMTRSPVAAAAPASTRRLADDEAAALVRAKAIEHGTTDLATLSSKTGLPSSQVGRVLPLLTKQFAFRKAVEDAAAAAAAPKAAARVPAADLLEGVAAQNTGGKVTPVTLRQEAAIQRAQAQAVTIGDYANRLRRLQGEARGAELRRIAKEKGRDFARKVAKEVGMSSRSI